MARTIQMIYMPPDNYLFITGFTTPDVLSFRTSHNLQQVQKEKIEVKDNVVYTNLYHFPAAYLLRFLEESESNVP